MALPLILDENSRGRDLWRAVQTHNREQPLLSLDIVRVGDPGTPIAGTQDPQLLEWSIIASRVIITQDVTTLVGYHNAMVKTGATTPGLFVIRQGFGVHEIVAEITTYSYCLTPAECSCQVWYLP
jgi:hypothetical protein